MKILETIRFIILNNVYKVGGTIHKVCHYVNLFVMYSQYSDIQQLGYLGLVNMLEPQKFQQFLLCLSSVLSFVFDAVCRVSVDNTTCKECTLVKVTYWPIWSEYVINYDGQPRHNQINRNAAVPCCKKNQTVELLCTKEALLKELQFQVRPQNGSYSSDSPDVM